MSAAVTENRPVAKPADPLVLAQASWFDAGDKFFIAAVPIWFNFLGWVLILAALKFVSKASEDGVANVVYYGTLGVFWQYLNACFMAYELRRASQVSSRGWLRAFSLGIGGLIAWTAAVLAAHLADLVAKHTSA